jgi:hypothetical protein
MTSYSPPSDTSRLSPTSEAFLVLRYPFAKLSNQFFFYVKLGDSYTSEIRFPISPKLL